MDKRDLIPAGICIAVLLGWMVYTSSQQRPAPVAPSAIPAAVVASIKPPASSTPVAAVVPGSAAPAPITGGTLEASGTTPAPTADALLPEFVGLAPAPLITLRQGDLLEATIDPQLGGLSKVVLDQVKSQDRKGKMELSDADRPMLALGSSDQWRFSNAHVRAHDDAHVEVARQILGTPLVLVQSWAFDPVAKFSLRYGVSIQNTGTQPVNLNGVYLSTGVIHPLDTPQGFFGAGGVDQSADLRLTGKSNPEVLLITDIKKMEEKGKQEHAVQPLDWAAVQNKYFALLVSGSRPFAGALLHAPLATAPGSVPGSHLLTGELLLPPAAIPANGVWQEDFSVFVGAKHFDLLTALGNNKKSIMNFDQIFFQSWRFTFMEWISRLLLWALTSIEKALGNYGVAVILVTIVLRILFFPLTHRTTVLSKRMQKLQPLMKELKEKYASDPAKLNTKVMELYREHKVNPLGGCLPVLVQIPVFFALFNVLRSAIELRQRGFLWASDLSLPDTIWMIPGIGLPLNPLALLMGGTMILQQHLMPTTPDPNQQKMMLFMSVFFVFMLYTMPSGLTLYWTTNQLCAILQYRITQRLLNKEVGLPVNPTPA